MSSKSLEKELTTLKKRLSTLEAKVAVKAPLPSWRDAYGAMKGSPLHREAAALGALWREKENKRK
jgi:hypothetical protein